MLPFDWRRVLIYTHRWLGIAGGVLFLSWFLSGIVMMYAGMPSLTPEERRWCAVTSVRRGPGHRDGRRGMIST